MPILNKKEPILLGIGDIVIFVISLFLTLTLRYRSIPSAALLDAHLIPFTIIFAYSIVVFYISGLYGRMVAIARGSIPVTIIKAQIANGIIAVFLFYFTRAFDVAPRANLFLFLAFSTLLLILWRISTHPLLSLRRRYPALVIGSGPEADELVQEMSVNQRLGIYCKKQIDPAISPQDFAQALEGNDFEYIVTNSEDEGLEALLPELYKRYFPQARIVDLHDLYEATFDRIPLSCMNYGWIMTHISSISPLIYDAVKRLIDILLAIPVGLVALISYPFVAFAIKIEDHGPIFIHQERIGKNGKTIVIYKYRSMQRNEWDKWVKEGDNKVTRVGRFLRKSRLDEFPQALSILKGDLSLIGPRTDIIDLGKRLEQTIPYYSIRTVIKPGVTGWAQVNQEKPPQSVEETKIRLSYDLYYIKHRSLGLDLRIILRTLKTLLSRAGM